MNALKKFEHIVAWYGDHVGGQVGHLIPQADPGRIGNIESLIGEALPSDIKTLIEHYDGEDQDGPDGVFLGHALVSVATILDNLEFAASIADDVRFAECTETVTPDGAIKRKYFHLKWLPLIGDYGGNFIGVDLDPGPVGKKGQVIVFGRDELDVYVVADSWEQFLDRMIDGGETYANTTRDDGHLHTILKMEIVERL